MPRHTRKNGIFRRVYSPVKHAIMASKESISAVTNTAKYVACDGLTGLDKIGSSVARHANMAVNDLLGTRKTHRGKRSVSKKTKKQGRR
jgi:hypothetical protein